jgi:nucleoside-diphosphate-sugar epimerase
MAINPRRKAQLVIGLAFFLGAATGGLSTYLFFNQRPQPVLSVTDVANELSKRVGLEAPQRAQVEDILTESRKQYKQVREQMRQQNQTVRDATRAKIRLILSPKQQISFDEWVREMDAKRNQREREESKPK